jgi:hypothetical protein
MLGGGAWFRDIIVFRTIDNQNCSRTSSRADFPQALTLSAAPIGLPAA